MSPWSAAEPPALTATWVRLGSKRGGGAETVRRLREPVALLGTVPGIGRVTVGRLHHDLGIQSRLARVRRVAPRASPPGRDDGEPPFNPSGEAWLPVLHTHRGERHYTVLYSNTARAHRLGKTRDWVVLYYDGDDGERQCTVLTSERGPLRGRRIVRGREAECLALPGASP